MNKRDEVVQIMQNWVGATRGSSKHWDILNIYNNHKPLPRNHKLTINEAWCAATVSAAFIKAGIDQITPIECSCTKMIEQAKDLNIWVEDDNYQYLQHGDAILYDWNDNGVGDCTGQPDHIGIIEVVNYSIKRMTIIEGNSGSEHMCKRVTIPLNSRYIRGFICPLYDAFSDYDPGNYATYTVKKGDTLSKLAKAFGCKVSDIIKWNEAKYPAIAVYPNWIIIGWELIIKC